MNEYLSKSIYITRLPLILGPIFIHAVMNEGCTMQMLFHNLGMTSVPVLYLVSGYLFWGGYKSNKESLVGKYKSRIKSLVIPYLLWNLLAYVFFCIMGGLKWSQLITSFWGNAGSNAPADYPLWFVRTLILIMPTIPFIYELNRRKYLCHLSVLLMICWFFHCPSIFGHGTLQGLVLFNFGAYLRIQGVFDKKKLIPSKLFAVVSMIAWITLNFLWTVATDEKYMVILENGATVAGAFSYYSLGIMLPKECSNNLAKVGKSSFFAYCFFAIALHLIKNSFVDLDFTNFIGFLILSISVLMVGVGLYYLLNRFTPRVCSILSGSR